MEKFKPYAFLFIAALLYALSFPNIFEIYFPLGAILGTGILFYHLISEKGIKRRITYYLYYNLIITGVSFYWIAATLQEFGNIPLPIAAVINMLYALVFNPQIWLFILSLYYSEKKNISIIFHQPLVVLGLSVTLTSMEYWIPQQFPVMLGQPWIIFSNYLGLASYFGIPAYSFFSYLLVFQFVSFIKYKKVNLFPVLATILFVLLNLIVPLPLHPYKPEGKLNVRLVQANISNFLKVDSESGRTASVQEVLTRYKSLSLEKFKNEEHPELIIWPETAYPYPIYTRRNNLADSSLPLLMYEITSEQQSSFFFGGYDHYKNNTDGSQFNSEQNAGILVTPKGQVSETYHKHILIPFGETLPLGPLTKYFSQFVPDMAFFKEGEKFPLFKIKKNIQFISTICYEGLQPEFIRSYLNSIPNTPHFMINLTNDSWYGDTVEPEQHLFLTKWRSLELNLPILRSTNTGISTIVDEKAQELSRLKYGIAGNLDISLPIVDTNKKEITFFQKFGFWGNIPIWILLFIFQALLLKLKNEK